MKNLLKMLDAKIKKDISEKGTEFILDIYGDEIKINEETFKAAESDDPKKFLKELFDFCDIELKQEFIKNSHGKYIAIHEMRFVYENIIVDIDDAYNYILKNWEREEK